MWLAHALSPTPTRLPATGGVPQMVGHYGSAEDAARARDRAAICLQSNPRLNSPAEVHSEAQLRGAVKPMLAAAARYLPPQIERQVDAQVSGLPWERRVGRFAPRR
jgi:hypothetical protein